MEKTNVKGLSVREMIKDSFKDVDLSIKDIVDFKENLMNSLKKQNS